MSHVSRTTWILFDVLNCRTRWQTKRTILVAFLGTETTFGTCPSSKICPKTTCEDAVPTKSAHLSRSWWEQLQKAARFGVSCQLALKHVSNPRKTTAFASLCRPNLMPNLQCPAYTTSTVHIHSALIPFGQLVQKGQFGSVNGEFPSREKHMPEWTTQIGTSIWTSRILGSAMAGIYVAPWPLAVRAAIGLPVQVMQGKQLKILRACHLWVRFDTQVHTIGYFSLTESMTYGRFLKWG